MDARLCFLVVVFWTSGLPMAEAVMCNGYTTELTAQMSCRLLTSPSFQRSTSCSWRIRSFSNNYGVLLEGVARRLANTNTCNSTSLTIYDGNSYSAPVLVRLCSDSKDTAVNYTSTGQFLFLNYRISLLSTMTSFNFSYLAVPRDTVLSDSPKKSTSMDNTQIGLTVVAVCVAAVMVVACFAYCMRKRNSNPSRHDNDEWSNIHINGYFNTGDDELQPRGVRNSGFHHEMELPPNYSEIFSRNETASEAGPAANERPKTGVSEISETGVSHISREDSYISIAPPVYADFMLELYPPESPIEPGRIVDPLEQTLELGQSSELNTSMGP